MKKYLIPIFITTAFIAGCTDRQVEEPKSDETQNADVSVPELEQEELAAMVEAATPIGSEDGGPTERRFIPITLDGKPYLLDLEKMRIYALCVVDGKIVVSPKPC